MVFAAMFRHRAHQEGREEGREEGRQEGQQEGREEGRATGPEETNAAWREWNRHRQEAIA